MPMCEHTVRVIDGVGCFSSANPVVSGAHATSLQPHSTPTDPLHSGLYTRIDGV